MALPAGSFYTEPSGVAHFAETPAEPVVVYLTGDGPSDTQYVKTTAEPACSSCRSVRQPILPSKRRSAAPASFIFSRNGCARISTAVHWSPSLNRGGSASQGLSLLSRPTPPARAAARVRRFHQVLG